LLWWTGLFAPAVRAQGCPTATPQSISTNASRGKYGFSCTIGSSCVLHYYLAENIDADGFSWVENFSSHTPPSVSDGIQTPSVDVTSFIEYDNITPGTRIQYPDPNTVADQSCPPSVTATGYTNQDFEFEHITIQTMNGGAIVAGNTGDCTWENLNGTLISTEGESGGGPCNTALPEPDPYDFPDYYTCSSPAAVCPVITSGTICFTNPTAGNPYYNYTDTNNGATYTQSDQYTEYTGSTYYSAEYTTMQLVSLMSAAANAGLPSGFPDDNPPTGGGNGPSSDLNVSTDESCASATVSRWRVWVVGTVQGQQYDLTYDITETTGNVTSPAGHGKRTISGQATNFWYPSADGEILPIPKKVAGVCSPVAIPGNHGISYSNFKVTPSANPGAPGAGTGDDNSGGAGGDGTSSSGGSGSGCTSCGQSTTSVGGNGTGTYPGVSMKVSMGRATGGGSAGEFQLQAMSPNTGPSQVSSLVYTHETDTAAGVQVVADASGQLIQVVTPQAFAVVTTNWPYGYQLAVCTPAAQGGWDAGTSTYAYDTNGNVISTWTVFNPDASPTVSNRLEIIEQPTSGTSNVWLYTWNTNTGVWSVSLPASYASSTAFSLYDSGSGNTTNIVQYTTPSSTVVAQKASVVSSFTWGSAVVQEIFGTGSASRTNNFSYYATTNAAGYVGCSAQPPLQQAALWDGTWQYYSAYDGQGRPLTVLQGLDCGPTNNASLCLSTTNSYTPFGTGDDGTVSPNSPRKTVQFFKGTPVSTSYAIYTTNLTQIIVCTNATGLATDPGNLITTTYKCTNGFYAGWPQSVVYPDGTMTIYSYGSSADFTSQTNTVATGQPGIGGTNIVDGTMTTTILGNVGQVLSSTVADISSGLTIQSDSYTYLDDFDRSYTVTHIDGTSETYQYDCCELDSMTDRDGVTTYYGYDPLKRLVSTTRLGIATTNLLDAAGNILSATRVGTNNSAITLSSIIYDTSGHVIFQTNALGGVTSLGEYLNASGFDVRASTNADGGTRLETRYDDGSTLSVTGTAVYGVGYTNGVETVNGKTCRYLQATKLDASGAYTSEWTKTDTDPAGRTIRVIYPDGSTISSVYNSAGQLSAQIDPDGVTNLFGYNAKGEQCYTATDMNGNGVIDFSGADRINWTTNYVTTVGGTTVTVGQNYVWATNSSSAALLLSTTENSRSTLETWQTAFGLTTESVTVYTTNGTRTITTTNADNSYSINQYTNGRLMSVTQKDSAGTQIGKTSYAYDPHGRVNQTTDARNGTTTVTFNSADQVLTTTTPLPGNGSPVQVTSTTYDLMGRTTQTTLPDGGVVTNQYATTSDVLATGGARSYPVAYTYDPQGRMLTMKTWTNYANNSGTATTSWYYDTQRGWLTNKVYADGNGPKYQYTAAGRLKTRLWARGVNTTNSYTVAGDLATISYNDGFTSGVTNTYDRRGRLATVLQNGITTTLTLNDASEELSESFSAGVLNGLSVTNGYDSYLRRSTLWASGYGSTTTSYGYDNASRLSTASDGTYSAAYTYLANSPLVSQILFKQSSTTRMTTTKQYDYLNRLLAVSSAPSASGQVPVSFNYAYNQANQRTRSGLNDSSAWSYEYDALGQVTSGKRSWSDGTMVPGEQFQYTFDNIGNRIATLAGGDQNGGSLRSATYTANNLNEYSSRTVPGAADVIGAGDVSGTVTVNGQSTYRHGQFYQTALTLTNGSGAIWQSVTNAVVDGTTNSVTGNIFLPPSTENFTYDLDGNLKSDGRWTNTWDAENRLVTMQGLSSLPTGANKQLQFVYDWHGRRIQKIVSNWNGSSYVAQYTNRFLYDGWNLVAELNGANNALIRSYIWGTDLSGSIQGAGGVGGLLTVKPASGDPLFAAYDGNGNVSALVDATTGTNAAQYVYGPFGELVQTAPTGTNNPCQIRFSTKYCDDETDLFYYGFRYFNDRTGLWLARDPLAELGFEIVVARRVGPETSDGPNSFLFVHNNPVDGFDRLGLVSIYESCCCGSKSVVNRPIKTGLKTCTGKAHTVNVDHGWLEMDGGWSADFIAGSSIWWGPGVVRSPTDYARQKDVTCTDVYIFPCQTDVNKFRQAVKDAVSTDATNPPNYNFVFFNCFEWDTSIINKAFAKASGCSSDAPFGTMPLPPMGVGGR
jgi:RHS repeat-associated protein